MLLKRIENQEKPRWDLGKIENLNTLTLCSMSRADLLSLKEHLQLVVDVKTLSNKLQNEKALDIHRETIISSVKSLMFRYFIWDVSFLAQPFLSSVCYFTIFSHLLWALERIWSYNLPLNIKTDMVLYLQKT